MQLAAHITCLCIYLDHIIFNNDIIIVKSTGSGYKPRIKKKLFKESLERDRERERDKERETETERRRERQRDGERERERESQGLINYS